MEKLLKKLTVTDRNKILLTDIYNKWQNERKLMSEISFKPEINQKSRIIAKNSKNNKLIM
jgi:hypothetical protein